MGRCGLPRLAPDPFRRLQSTHAPPESGFGRSRYFNMTQAPKSADRPEPWFPPGPPQAKAYHALRDAGHTHPTPPAGRRQALGSCAARSRINTTQDRKPANTPRGLT